MAKNRGMLKLTSLQINRFRLVQPGTRLTFAPGNNVLVGKNGTGKTTLLNLLGCAISGNFFPLEAEEFDLEYDLQYGQQGVMHIGVKSELPAPRTLPVELLSAMPSGSAGQDPPQLHLSIHFVPISHEIPEFKVHAAENLLVAQTQDKNFEEAWFIDGQRQGESLLMRALFQALRGLLRTADGTFEPGWALKFNLLLSSLLEYPFERYDEALDWIHATFLDASLTHSLFDATEIKVFERARIPEELLTVARDQYGTPDVLAATGVDLPFLKNAAEALELRDILLQMDKQEVGKPAIKRAGQISTPVTKYGNLRFYFTKRDGSRLPWHSLSFGQRRLFGYLYYLSIYKHIVLIDELANGLHHSMIDHAMAALGERQAFLATQNPLIFDELGFSSAEDVQRTFLRCETITDGDQELWRWSQFSAQEATDFLRDYRTGIQHTNDILRTRGLW